MPFEPRPSCAEELQSLRQGDDYQRHEPGGRQISLSKPANRCPALASWRPCFELASGGLRLGRSKLLLQHRDNRIIPGVMEILLCPRDVGALARPASLGVGRCMQRLMDVAYKMNQKSEVAGGAPFIVVAIAKAADVLVDFRRHAVPVWAPRRQICFAVLISRTSAELGCLLPQPNRIIGLEITAFGTRSLHQGFAGGGGKPIDAWSIT